MTDKEQLARIRENQRRSRARRKEYLQDLETRLRHCETQGVRASLEVQLAARKVIEENKRLRELLMQHGIPDNVIDQTLGESSAAQLVQAAAASGSGCGGEKGCSTDLNELDTLLGTTQPCLAASHEWKPGDVARASPAARQSTSQSSYLPLPSGPLRRLSAASQPAPAVQMTGAEGMPVLAAAHPYPQAGAATAHPGFDFDYDLALHGNTFDGHAESRDYLQGPFLRDGGLVGGDYASSYLPDDSNPDTDPQSNEDTPLPFPFDPSIYPPR